MDDHAAMVAERRIPLLRSRHHELRVATTHAAQRRRRALLRCKRCFQRSRQGQHCSCRRELSFLTSRPATAKSGILRYCLCHAADSGSCRAGQLHVHRGWEMGMKKVLGLVGAALLFAGPALAADLGKPVYKAPAPALLPTGWGGFYIGIHGGYGWGHVTTDDIFPFPSSNSPKGGLFGVQAGYNWQFGTFVTGLEVDSSWADLKDRKSVV